MSKHVSVLESAGVVADIGRDEAGLATARGLGWRVAERRFGGSIA